VKKFLPYTLLAFAIAATPVLAHHAAEDIIDEEIWAMIDSLVADTPHAELSFEDMGSGMTETTLTTRTLNEMENLIDDGLLDYASRLEGDVDVNIQFAEDGDVTLTLSQRRY
jgi:hypothetical protein